MGKCATCWFNPQTGRSTGYADTNWLCERCEKLPANRAWRSTPHLELVRDYEDTDVRATPESACGPFETPTCITIMKFYCMGLSERETAKMAGVQRSYVTKTVSYWKKHRGVLVKDLRKLFASARAKQ